MVLTDELAELLKDQPDAITGVLAHELGHVRHRHGLRMVVQTSLLASLISVVVGDVSSLLATVPAVLTEQAYSREAERESDQESVDILRKAGISPAVMVVFFERIEAWRKKEAGGDGPRSCARTGTASAREARPTACRDTLASLLGESPVATAGAAEGAEGHLERSGKRTDKRLATNSG